MTARTAPIPFAGCFTPVPSADARLAFVGMADDTQSSFRKGCADGPRAIRIAYDGRSFHSTTETGIDLAESVVDIGDLTPAGPWSESHRRYRERIEEILAAGQTPFVAGGDHAVTVPVIEAYRSTGTPIHVVQIDAHPDAYPEYAGSGYSHACVAARLLEMPHVLSVTQLGIRTLNAEQHRHIEVLGDRLHMFFARQLSPDLPRSARLPPASAVYLTVDLDGLDPSAAPGVSHPVPGGLTARQVLNLIQSADWELVGMDVVELNPSVDLNRITAILAARLLHEGMGYVSSTKRL